MERKSEEIIKIKERQKGRTAIIPTHTHDNQSAKERTKKYEEIKSRITIAFSSK